MADSTNPIGEQNGSDGPPALQGAGAVTGVVGSGNSTAAEAMDDAATSRGLKHNPGVSLEWSAEEQSVLEEGLTKYTSESSATCYAKIARELQDKTIRDVVFRCRWMSKKENGKRRKDDYNQMRKNNKKGGPDSSKSSGHLAARASMPHALPMKMPEMVDDDIPYKEICGPTGQLLEQNTKFSDQISVNLASFQIQDNINLLCKMRDNILTIMNDTNDMPETMNQMPPLPVKVDEELANSILPSAPLQMQS